MIKPDRPIPTALLLLTLSGCGTTHRFVDEPELTVGEPDKTTHQAAAELFNGPSPYTVTLCEADPILKECKKGSDSIRANGVGGLFLPLLVNADFSIDRIDPHTKVFTGFYKITFHGTGNAAGSGYYRAVILPAESNNSDSRSGRVFDTLI